MNLSNIYTRDKFRALRTVYSVVDPKIILWTEGREYEVGQILPHVTENWITKIDIKDDSGRWGVLTHQEFKDLFINLSARKAADKIQ